MSIIHANYFNALTSLELQTKDYILDFANNTQTHNIVANINILNGRIFFYQQHNFGTNPNTLNSFRPADNMGVRNTNNNLFTNRPETNSANIWGIYVESNGTSIPNSQTNLFPNIQTQLHKTNSFNNTPINPPLNNTNQSINGLQGPYTIPVNTEGTYDIDFYIYNLEFRQIQNSATITYLNGIQRAGNNVNVNPNLTPFVNNWKKTFSFNTFQKAITITKDNSNNILLPQNPINTFVGNSLTFNKTANRGDSVQSTFEILKANSPNSFTLAIVGLDFNYTISTTNPTNNDIISVTFLNQGTFIVRNTAEGNNSIKTGVSSNKMIQEFWVQVGVAYLQEITYPVVNMKLKPSLGYPNLIINSSLNGKNFVSFENFSFETEIELDLVGSRIWTSINGVVTDLDMSSDLTFDWLSYIESLSTVVVNLYKNGNLIDIRNGFGPHTFIVDDGIYSVELEIS